MFGRELFENHEFRLRAGIFGSVTVRSKPLKRTFRVTATERTYFRSLCSELEMRDVKLEPRDKAYVKACEEFCDAVVSRPDGRWRVYFIRFSPSESAQRAARYK